MIHIYTDANGAYEGVCCISYVVVDDGAVVHTQSATARAYGKGNHNIAEHMAVFEAIKHALREKYPEVTIHSDSQSTVNHVNDTFYHGSCRANGRYRPYVEKIVELSRQFRLFKIEWEPRGNQHIQTADEHCRHLKRGLIAERYRKRSEQRCVGSRTRMR